MNSYKLKEIFSKAYDEIFIKSDIVISLPVSVWISWGTSCIFGWLIINQTIPQRIYIWIKKNISNKIIVKSYKKINFKTKSIEECKDDDFFSPWINFLKELEALYPNTWVDIFIFSEYEWKNSDIISSWILISIWLLLWKINLNNIFKWKNDKVDNLYKDPIFIELLNKTLALRLQYNKSTLWWSSLVSVISWIIDTNFPVFHIKEKIIKEDTKNVISVESLEKVEFSYITKKLNDLVLSNIDNDMPFDIYLISIGDYKNTNWFRSFVNWWISSNEVKNIFLTSKKENSNFFLELYDSNSFLEKSVNLISSYTFHIANTLINTIEWKEKIDHLFFYLKRNIELIKTLLWKTNIISFEQEQFNIEKLSHFIMQIYPDIKEKDFIIYTTGASVDMKYAILVPNYLQKINEEIINNELNKNFWNNAALIYSSKNDGFNSEGLIIEQDTSKQIFTSKLSYDDYIIKDIYWDIEIWSYEDLILKNNNWIIFDTFHKKILINWEKLTSKDILSQNSTIEIVSLLFNNIGNEINNLSFSKSSYSKNKNEMLGKIIIPFLKIVKERYDIELPIICKWGLNNFFLKLENTNVPLYFLIKK